ncbi:MAG: hypothetical protein OXB84_06440 [Halobacteriovoraceae bacterium]|nr:hypothetical protein [Halobacteriovoraceae bacterium]
MPKKTLTFFMLFGLFCWRDARVNASDSVPTVRNPVILKELENAPASEDQPQSRTSAADSTSFTCDAHKFFMPHELVKNLLGGKPIEISKPVVNEETKKVEITITSPAYLATCIDTGNLEFASFHIKESNNIMVGLKNNTTYSPEGRFSIGDRTVESPIDGYFKCLCENEVTCNKDGSAKSEIKLDGRNINSVMETIEIPVENFNPDKPMQLVWANPFDTADEDNSHKYNPPAEGWSGEYGCYKLSRVDDIISEEELYLENLKKICENGTSTQIKEALESIEDEYAPIRKILKAARDNNRESEIDEILKNMKQLADGRKDDIKEALDNPSADDPPGWLAVFLGKYNVWLDKYGRLTKQLKQELKQKMIDYQNSQDGGERDEIRAEIVKLNQLIEKFSQNAGDSDLENVAKLTASNDYSEIAFDIEKYRLESEFYRRVHPKNARKGEANYQNRESFASADEAIDKNLQDIGELIEEAQRRFEARTGRKVYSKYEEDAATRIRENTQHMIQNYQKQAQETLQSACYGSRHAPNTFDQGRCQRAHRKINMRKAILDNYLKGANQRLTQHSRRLATYGELEAMAEAYAIKNRTFGGPNGSYLSDYASWGGDDFYYQDPNLQYNPYPSYNVYDPTYGSPQGPSWQQASYGPTEFNLFN